MRERPLFVAVLVAGLLAGGCLEEGQGNPAEVSQEEANVLELITLPDPQEDSTISLESTLAERESVRDFADRSLEWEALGQLLWAAQGQTRSGAGRTNPSAGGLYPLEIYLVTGQGFYHYVIDGHRIEQLSAEDLRDALSSAALGQEAVRDAPAVFVICGVFSRTEARYGDRAERYVHLEAGHVGQSLLLQAVALDLGGVPIGAFSDDEVQAILGLGSDHEPLYLVPIGSPAS